MLSYNLLKSAKPLPTDPDFNAVTLLMHMDGANGGTAFIDSSSYGWVPQVVSQATTLDNGKFGQELAISSTGTVEFAHWDSWRLSGNYTIEIWAKPLQLGRLAHLIVCGQRVDTAQWAIDLTAGDIFQFYFQSNGAATQHYVQGPAVTLNVGQYYHVVAEAFNGNVTVYVDGVAGTPLAYAGTYFNSVNLISFNRYNNTPYDSVIRVDEVRITQAIARYQGAFTPPTLPFPDIQE